MGVIVVAIDGRNGKGRTHHLINIHVTESGHPEEEEERKKEARSVVLCGGRYKRCEIGTKDGPVRQMA